jgi:predicted SprT family Zn-dependent metalloprotease
MIESAVNQYINEARQLIKSVYNYHLKLHAIKFSSRMKRVNGKAIYEKTNFGTFYTITISTHVYQHDSIELKKTVFHEIAHILDHQLYGGWSHGATWKKVMISLGQSPDRLKSQAALQEAGHSVYKRKQQLRYLVKCKTCNHYYKMSGKKFNNIENYRCKCRGVLQYTGEKVDLKTGLILKG